MKIEILTIINVGLILFLTIKAQAAPWPILEAYFFTWIQTNIATWPQPECQIQQGTSAIPAEFSLILQPLLPAGNSAVPSREIPALLTRELPGLRQLLQRELCLSGPGSFHWVQRSSESLHYSG